VQDAATRNAELEQLLEAGREENARQREEIAQLKVTVQGGWAILESRQLTR
jgi:hypothetical protein